MHVRCMELCSTCQASATTAAQELNWSSSYAFESALRDKPPPRRAGAAPPQVPSRVGGAPAACRAAGRCNAWFWCKDSGRGDCLDQQSGTWVPWHGCKLLALPVLPAPLVDPAALVETSEASLFRSFAAGYVKRAPPRRALTYPSASVGSKLRPSKIVSCGS